MIIQLRPIRAADYDVLFEQQLDPEAVRMAAFTAKDPSDRDAFHAHMTKMFADESLTYRIIDVDGAVAGSILCHTWFGDPEISYWLGREFWGRGIATQALDLFLQEEPRRPLHARVVQDNLGSQRVLEKNRFVRSGEDEGFAHGRGTVVKEWIYQLT